MLRWAAEFLGDYRLTNRLAFWVFAEIALGFGNSGGLCRSAHMFEFLKVFFRGRARKPGAEAVEASHSKEFTPTRAIRLFMSFACGMASTDPGGRSRRGMD